MNYQIAVVADVRLRMLQLLAAASEYTQPIAALGGSLVTQYGHALSSDRLAVETAWLDDNGLLIRRPVGATAILVITARGLDVALGRAEVPGVARPRPGE